MSEDGGDLRAALAAVEAADSVVFRSGRAGPAAEVEVVGAGCARLSAEETLLVTVVVSPREAERLAAERGVPAADLQTWMGPSLRPLCWWFAHGRRWTWMDPSDGDAGADQRRPGPRQENDPMLLLDLCRDMQPERSERLPGGVVLHAGHVEPRASRWRRRSRPERVQLEALVGEEGALREIRGTREGRTRALILDEIGAPLRFPAEVDHGLGRELVGFAQDLPAVDWAAVQTRVVAGLTAP